MRCAVAKQCSDVGDVLLALPKLAWRLGGPLRDKLLHVADRASGLMSPQAGRTLCER